jgi:Met-zincin/Domain of unknown function (DUF5117)
MTSNRLSLLVTAALASVLQSSPAQSPVPVQTPPGGMPSSTSAPKPPDFPPLDEVTKDFSPVNSSDPNGGKMLNLWRRDKDQQLLAELPQNFSSEKFFIAMTVAGGESYAGLQQGDVYGYWSAYDKKIAFIEPNLAIKSTGDDPSKSSVKRLFTDRVFLETSILTYVKPQGGPVIDLDAVLVGQAEKFFGVQAAGLNKGLYKLKTVKLFADNIEISIEAPIGNGTLRTLHYSISRFAKKKLEGYEPRVADTRVGYFTTGYTDFGKFKPDEVRMRYINRWNLQKADPSLKLSPPKEAIKFYIESTVPVRYRRWVREGLLAWNQAFEKVGLINAVIVEEQNAITGENMDKDPEDVNYNFVRWLNNGIGTAIGPSRVNPETGQILDADIILTDGWLRHWWQQYNEVMPSVAMEGYSPETLSWLWQNPNWDPRIRLASPVQREKLLSERASQPEPAYGGHALAQALAAASDGSRLSSGQHEYEGLMGRLSQRAGLCMAPSVKTMGLAQMEMSLETVGPEAMGVKADDQMLDGVPETFIGPLMIDLVAHECGHTLGLRHNFKASSIYTYEQIQSAELKGKKPFTGSVMDYTPINIVAGADPAKKGDIGMISVGPYDLWAIEYGYTFEKDLKPVLQRVAEPELVYGTDEDSWGPDPLARRYDFSKDPLAYAENQMVLIRQHREKLVEKFVKDGDSWARARRGYQMTLMSQMRSLSTMANWLGGSYVNRDKKGDKNGRNPVEPVSAEQQRKAMQFCIAQSFPDTAYGLTPDILRHLTTDKWYDGEDDEMLFDDGTWDAHDTILGLQASVMTSLLNPTTLTRIYDNELRVAAAEDAVTLPECSTDCAARPGASWKPGRMGPTPRGSPGSAHSGATCSGSIWSV